jgi:hypothetical protein
MTQKRYDIIQHATPGHWVVFLARPEAVADRSFGHAFVQFGYRDDAARATRFDAWGFYPEGKDKGYSAVPGAIVDDVKTGSLSQQSILVSVQVTKASFDAARDVMTRWQRNPPDYRLYNAKNCIDFVDQVAKALRLRTPSTTVTLPTMYINGLGESNR